jgi:5-methylcytosine-specific restriction endonuclease McrA
MSISDDFLAPRACFLEPIAELEQVADMLADAADCLLAGNHALARELLQRADMPAVRAYAARVMGPVNTEIHRYRDVPGLPAVVATSDRATARKPSASVEAAIFARDGYRCRYCGCRVVLAKARKLMASAVPDALQWGNADRDRHAAFYALTAVVDHMVPHARGGTNEPDNLVTTCQACNYGKNNWLIEEVGLIDPRTHPPIRDNWDGLGRMLGYTGRSPAPTANHPAREIRRTRSIAADAASRDHAAAGKPSPEEWFSTLDRTQEPLSARLLALLDGCKDLDLTWSLNKVLLVRMSVGNTALDLLGILENGEVEIPWYIAGHKEKFEPFAESLAAAIPRDTSQAAGRR